MRHTIGLTVTNEEKKELVKGIMKSDKFTAKIKKYALRLVRKSNG